MRIEPQGLGDSDVIEGTMESSSKIKVQIHLELDMF